MESAPKGEEARERMLQQIQEDIFVRPNLHFCAIDLHAH
jgi:hypothetical protein